MADERRRHPTVLTVVVCAAGPAGRVGRLVDLVRTDGWDVDCIATPAAEAFIDMPALTRAIGKNVASSFPAGPTPGRLPDAVVVAPATFNTINKWASGIADNFALTVLAEFTGARVPIVVLPFVNSLLAANPVFARSVAELRACGVDVLLGPEDVQPHPPRPGVQVLESYPWHRALDTVRRRLASRAESSCDGPGYAGDR